MDDECASELQNTNHSLPKSRMANPRPNFIDLRSGSYQSSYNGLPSPRGPLGSPRLHVAGDVPPDLSPLDAFAAHSRQLAKQLEESIEDGRRMSRLPHCAVASSLNQRRPNFERAASIDEAGAFPSNESGPEQMPEVEEPDYRHMSVHARMSGGMPTTKPNEVSRLQNVDEEPARGRSPSVREPQMYGMRQEESPGALDRHPAITMQGASPSYFPERPSNESMRQRRNQGRRPAELADSRGRGRGRGFDIGNLAPPRSPYAQRTPSPISVSNDSVDEDLMGGSFLSQPRKQSSSSVLSSSPVSPYMHARNVPRSPSVSSEMSIGGTRLPRPAFNFSRPISRASGPPVESRQNSTDSQPYVTTPISSTHSTEEFDDPNASPAPTYVYSTFQLPRGRKPQRNSLLFQGGRPGLKPQGADQPPSPTSSEFSRPSQERDRQSSDNRRPSHDHLPAPQDQRSINSGSTIKAGSALSEMSTEDRVAMAIDFHSRGEVTKSTYHLRIAAKHGNVTGMLLYALAVRNGWGCRQNLAEGARLLRQAVDSLGLEVADTEGGRAGKLHDALEKKGLRAEFALAIYELGVSHLNGWGVPVDKPLALRFFEIAADLGDLDALQEAAHAYATGSGCKKSLPKSAKLYRKAEKMGASMVGQSWIHKDKYQSDDENQDRPVTADSPSKHGHGRSKSKSRGMFGRKKAHQ